MMTVLLCLQQVTWLAMVGRIPPSPLHVMLYLGPDLLFALILGGVLLVLQRPNTLALAIAVATPLILLNLSGAKFATLGDQAFVSDILLLPDLLRVLPPATALCVLAAALGLGAAFLLNIAPRRLAFLALSVAGCGAALQATAPLATSGIVQVTIGAMPREFDFPVRGHFMGALVALVEDAEQRMKDRLLASAASDDLGPVVPTSARIAARDVHIIVLESFVDPLATPAIVRPDPFPPLFAAWRDAAGGRLVAPVFGNRSSNTEFEVLCGLPAFGGRYRVVTMSIPAGSELPCLPRLLAARGFRTVSLVPSSSEIFRAGAAFLAMGFSQRRFEADLHITDRDGVWAAAGWTLAEARGLRSELGRDAPALVYTFVNAGHHPFDRDRARRPDRIAVTPSSTLAHDWANGIHHTALAVEAHVTQVLAEDPDALILVMGDHWPPLLSLVPRPAAAGSDPLHHAPAYATPLLVLDRGTIRRTGWLPAWHLPHLILDILSEGATCDAGMCPHRGARRLRPIGDRILVLDETGREVGSCAFDDTGPACAETRSATAGLRASLARMLEASKP